MKITEVDPNNLTNDLIKKIFYNTKKEKYTNVDYLIIYGCHLKEVLMERLEHSLDIIKNHPVKMIVLTGGVGVKGDFNESKYMYDFLIKNGIDKDKILIEDKSTTTEENNLNIMKMLNLEKASSPIDIVLDTQELHFFRIKLHWDKILQNKNVHFYYDYVEDSILSYDNVINSEFWMDIVKNQVVKTKYFISQGVYDNPDII